MEQSDNQPDPNIRQGRQHRQILSTHQSTVAWSQNAGKTPAAQNTNTHPFPPCSRWLSAETLVMHCTVNDHKPTLLPHYTKKDGSSNSTRRDGSDSFIRQCGPSTTARLCLQHQHTGDNPSLALQLYEKQMSVSSFSAARI